MIFDYNHFNIYEKILISEDNIMDIAILFTDIVGSSKKWKNNESEMIKALEDLSIVVDKIVKKYNGVIIKTIGDAYMVSFKTLKESVQTGLQIQKELTKNNIKVGKDAIELRIGMCYGPVYETTVDAQGKTLLDYLGNTVNTASRIESEVSEAGEIAFASLVNKKDNFDNLLKDFDVDLITFKNKKDKIKRSSRLLTDIQRHMYKSIDKLKGVDILEVYHVKNIK